MRQLVTVAALMALGAAHAATTYSVNGVLYVNLREFAAENGMTYRSDVNGIVLKSGSKAVKLFPYSTAATLNGVKFTLAGAVRMEAGDPAAPIVNMERAFGLKASTPPAAAPASTTPAPPVSNSGKYGRRESAVAYGLNPFQGDYARLPLAAAPTESEIVGQCLRAVAGQAVNPDSFKYNTLELVIFKDGIYWVSGNGTARSFGGTTGPVGFNCYARQAEGFLFVSAHLN